MKAKDLLNKVKMVEQDELDEFNGKMVQVSWSSKDKNVIGAVRGIFKVNRDSYDVHSKTQADFQGALTIFKRGIAQTMPDAQMSSRAVIKAADGTAYVVRVL